MIEHKITIINKLGLHARAAAKLVNLASQFNSKILLKSHDKEVDAKSIMGIMLLAASKGKELIIIVSGDDENDALAAITELIQGKFDEAE